MEVNFEPGGPPLPMVFAKALDVASPDVLPKDIDFVGSSEYYPTQWLYGKVYYPLSPLSFFLLISAFLISHPLLHRCAHNYGY